MGKHTRRSFVQPGYDCIHNPCGKRGCGTHEGSNHGIHNDVWNYLVSDDEGDVTLALTVGSGVYPSTVSAHSRSTEISGYSLVLHAAFPRTREELLDVSVWRDCEWVKGGRCCGNYFSFSAATKFVEEHFVAADGFDQKESFWRALEKKFAQWAREARAERVDLTYERCSCCDGTGTVRRKDVSHG